MRDNGDAFRATLAQLLDLPIVGDLRGTGFFYALELVKDKETRETFDDEECETLLRGFLSPQLFESGLICRADDRGDPVIQISPPLIATQEEFDEITGILGEVLTEAWQRMQRRADDERSRSRRRASSIKSLRRFDMVFFTVCAFVGLDTLGTVASNGPQGFLWLARPGGRSSSRRTCC